MEGVEIGCGSLRQGGGALDGVEEVETGRKGL